MLLSCACVVQVVANLFSCRGTLLMSHRRLAAYATGTTATPASATNATGPSTATSASALD
jgi:hypothetical protein